MIACAFRWGRATLLPLVCIASLWGCESCNDAELTQLHPLIASSVDRVVFADTFVGASEVSTVRISNPGTRATRISRIVVEGEGFSLLETPPRGLEPGASESMTITFSPRVSGTHQGEMQVLSDAENDPVLSVILSGQGLDPDDCDDGNECTDERFDPTTGVCVRSFPARGCDDGNVCTENDRCDNGDCVGFAKTCSDGIACTVDACDAEVGCVFFPDNTACSDDDPCTLDTCGREGCENGPAPDGTPCGRIVQCEVVDLCVAQLCVPVAIPDGSPCNDANLCTRNDSCNDSVCAGTGVPQAPEVIGESHRLLAPWDAAIRDDTLLLLGDRLLTVPLDPSLPFAPVSGQSEVGTERRLSPEKAVLIRRGRSIVAVSPLPSRGPADGAHHLLFLSDDDSSVVEEVSLGQPVLRFANGAAYGEDVIALCDDGDNDDVYDVHFVDVAAPHAHRVINGAAGEVFCSSLSGHGSDGIHALDVRDGNVVVLDVDADLAVVGSVPADLPDAITNWRVRGELGFLSADDGENHVLVDISDPSSPRAVAFSLDRPVLLDDLVGTRMIAHDSQGFFMVDIITIEAPQLVDWRVPATSTALITAGTMASGDTDAFLFTSFPLQLFRVPLDAIGDVERVPFGGFGGMTRIAGDGDRLLGVARNNLVVIDATSAETALRPDPPSTNISIRGPSLVGRTVAAPVLFGPVRSDPQGLESGPIRSVDGDLRPALEIATDPVLASAIFTIDDVGTVDTEFGLPVGTLEEAQFLFAPVSGAFCNGAAIVQRRDGDADGDCVLGTTLDPDCNEGTRVQRLWIVSFSVCGGGVTPVTFAPLPDNDLDPASIASARSVAHGTTVSFFVEDTAFLVDIDSLLTPQVIATVVDARFGDAVALSAGFDQNVWVVGITRVDAAPAATFYDVDRTSGVAIARGTLVLGGPPPSGMAIRARVLGVSSPRAWLSTWDESEAFVRGHGLVAVDLFSDPLQISDALPLSSEATSLVADDDKLVVGRVDGISVISPPCSQP